MSFVHLHVHSHYSLLDGFSNLKKLVKRVKELEMPAVALTDHGTMFGVVEFFKEARAAGVKPIIGLEAYMSARKMTERDVNLDKKAAHLILLAENPTGYKNLLQIATAAQLEGFYYSPRIDRDFLAAHSEGLIASSACLAGEIPRAILNQGEREAHSIMDWYFDVFGRERFFLELQQHPIPELEIVNQKLLEMGKRYQAQYIATNDVHYINRSDARLQDVLLAVQTGSLLSDPNRMRMGDDSYYLRTPQEMAELFAATPDALENTLQIAERCNVDLSPSGYHLPIFTVPEGATTESYLRNLCEDGFSRRYAGCANCDEARKRMEYELKVIHDMGFDAYFLIVWDLCRHARQQAIWYNTRGSASGSLVAYVLDITQIDPLVHGLFFERFLNPGRISMPDIDLDFQDDRRAEIMEYCAQKYGDDHVAQIITFGTMGAKGAIRDVGRVMDIPLSEVDRIAKMIPGIPGKSSSIEGALEEVPEFKKVYAENDTMHNLIDTARGMEGVVRNAGTHAAGVIITDRPITEYLPLHRPTSGSADLPIKTVTQFEMPILDYLGLLKVDFLGLITLTVMQRACSLIEKRQGVKLSTATIPVDDTETYQLLGTGKTAGVFQFEGSGMTRYLVQMRPHNLAHLIAMVALYRPGPMQFIPSYIKRMHGEEEVSYRHPALEAIFKETYGTPIYQEQIMFAAISLAGYSPSESDELRSAISKKKAEQIEKHRVKFVNGCCANGIDENIAADIFKDWEDFARYGFNKSHAANYAVLAVQTAYLKTHYPVEYMAATLSASKNDTASIALYIADCKNMGINVLPPDVSASEWDFTIEDLPDAQSAIRFGLGAVKNVGQAPVELILDARKDGAFADLNDFARRVDLRQAGKRALESLIRVGALDRFGARKTLLMSLDRIISISSTYFREKQTGQMSFFGNVEGIHDEIDLGDQVETLDKREQLEWEKELIGLYVSDHPLSPYLQVLQSKVTHFSAQLGEAGNKEKVTVAGMIAGIRTLLTKTNKMMAFVTLEDIQGTVDLVLFPRTWQKFGETLEPGQVISASGNLDVAEGADPKILVDHVTVEELPDPSSLPPKADPLLQIPPEPPSLDPPVPWGNGNAGSRERAEPSGSTPRKSMPALPAWDEGIPPPPDGDDWYMNQPGFYHTSMEVAPIYAIPEISKSTPVDTSYAVGVTAPVSLQVSDANISPARPMEYILPPQMGGLLPQSGEEIPQMVTVTIASTGNKERDTRRLRHIHGILHSCPGKDFFSFLIEENGHTFMIQFPNDTTGFNTEIRHRLVKIVGEQNVRSEPIRFG